jgi:hypothetical protein
MRLKVLLLIIGNALCIASFAQTDSTDEAEEPIEWMKPSDNEKTRLGIVMGIQTATLFGNTLPSNKPMMGLLGGGYARYNFKRGFSLQQQFQVSFRGSNFNAAAGEISALRLLYLDFPLILYKKLNNKSKHRIGAGIQYARLVNTVMYIDTKSYPSGISPKLDNNDWSPVLMYQYQFDFFALQAAAKYGLRNLNLGNAWPENAKPLNNSGSLNNASIELNIIF